MHELGVLRNAVNTVAGVAEKNKIEHIKFITLEIGESSSFVPVFFEKLFPAAVDGMPLFDGTELRLVKVPGNKLVIKEIGY